VGDLDLSAPKNFGAFSILYVLSRLPWMDLGYGTDPDACREVLTGEYFWRTGQHDPSRLPGYHLQEFVTITLFRAGCVRTNLSTVLVSLLGVWFFARIVAKLDIKPSWLLVCAFAFTPLLWINSMTTLDYMWALTAVLGAYLLLLKDRPLLAGIALG